MSNNLKRYHILPVVYHIDTDCLIKFNFITDQLMHINILICSKLFEGNGLLLVNQLSLLGKIIAAHLIMRVSTVMVH